MASLELNIVPNAGFDTAEFDTSDFDAIPDEELTVTDSVVSSFLYFLADNDVLSLADSEEVLVSLAVEDSASIAEAIKFVIDVIITENDSGTYGHGTYDESMLYDTDPVSININEEVVTSALRFLGESDTINLSDEVIALFSTIISDAFELQDTDIMFDIVAVFTDILTTADDTTFDIAAIFNDALNIETAVERARLANVDDELTVTDTDIDFAVSLFRVLTRLNRYYFTAQYTDADRRRGNISARYGRFQ